MVTVEFYGIPRQRAGRADLNVPAGNVAELLAAIAQHCPALADLRRPDGRLAAHYLISLDGRCFINDPGSELRPGDRVLLLSADAGG